MLPTTACAAVLAVRPGGAAIAAHQPAPGPGARRVRLLLGGLRQAATDSIGGRTLGLFYDEGRAARRARRSADRHAGAPRDGGTEIVALTELALGRLLWWRKTRWNGLGLALALHVTIEPIAHADVLGWAMLALLLGAGTPRCRWQGAVNVRHCAHRALSKGQTSNPWLHVSSVE